MGRHGWDLSAEKMCVPGAGYHYTVCVCCSDVKLILEEFQSLNISNKRLQKVRVILLTPKCSVSAISNPVDFILQENGGNDLSAEPCNADLFTILK